MAPNLQKGDIAVLPNSNHEFPHNRRPPQPPDYSNRRPAQTNRGELPNYRHEKVRLESFAGFPSSRVNVRQLAEAGFYYTKTDDIVRCFACGIEVGRWEEGDSPLEEHKKWSRSCPFLNHMDVGNVPVDPSNPPPLPPVDMSQGVDECGLFGLKCRMSDPIIPSLEKLGIHRRYAPVHETYASLESRLKSFDTWPVGLKMRPQELAEAGFFYTGLGDKTVCFQCGGGLKDWAETDDPWREHALYFSKCSFLIQIKGRDFINEVLGKKPATLTPEEIQALPIPKEYTNIIKQRTSVPSSTASTSSASSSGSDSSSDVVTCSVISNERTKNEEERQASSSDASASTEAKKSSAKSEVKIDDAVACKICFSEEIGVLFLPCGHLVSCVNCAPSLTTCAVCRQPFTATVRAYLS